MYQPFQRLRKDSHIYLLSAKHPLRLVFLLAFLVILSFSLSSCSQDNQPGSVISQVWHGESAEAQHKEESHDLPGGHQAEKPGQSQPSKGEPSSESLKNRFKNLVTGKAAAKENQSSKEKQIGNISHDEHGAAGTEPSGTKISPDKQQLIGIKSDTVKSLSLEKTIRTVGRVDFDESRISHVNVKFPGYIEELYVNFTGTFVKKGDPLFRVYSPELVATHEEHLLALKAKKYFESSPFKEVSSGGHSLLEAVRQRLRLWDVSEEEIQQMEQEGKPIKYITIYAPIGGFVIEKMAFEGMAYNAGQTLFRIADLSTVWVQADIYEFELPLVRIGQKATIKLSYLPGQNFTGRLNYIYPYLEPQTRTAKVRFVAANPAGKLKPDMYADIELKVALGKTLAVPNEAVLDTGIRQMVFLDRGNGLFEPREVKLGQRVDEYQAVLDGIQEGDRIVTSANFLIDSESSLKAAMAGMKH